MTDLFTSDPHIGHKNIIRYCDRPFADVNEMNEAIIANHNAVVGPNDTIYYLGDLFFCGKGYALKVMARLNGKKHLILGNHDKMIKKNLDEFGKHFEFIGDYLEIRVQDSDAARGSQLICLSHYAHKVWNGSHNLSWNLYGHSHGSLPDDPNALQMDVGVDCNNFMPFTYADIKKRMAKKTFTALDHHGG